MAHTNNPLRDLQIVETEKFRRIQELFHHLKDMNKETNEISKDLYDLIEQLIHP